MFFHINYNTSRALMASAIERIIFQALHMAQVIRLFPGAGKARRICRLQMEFGASTQQVLKKSRLEDAERGVRRFRDREQSSCRPTK